MVNIFFRIGRQVLCVLLQHKKNKDSKNGYQLQFFGLKP